MIQSRLKIKQDFIRSCLFKALELEKDIHYRIRNYKLLSLYYQEIEVDPLSADRYIQEMELLKNVIKHEYKLRVIGHDTKINELPNSVYKPLLAEGLRRLVLLVTLW